MDAPHILDGSHPDAGPMEMFQRESSTQDDQAVHEAPESTRPASTSHMKAFGQYKMNHEDRGYALIINNREFQGGRLKERRGTDMDLKRILSVLRDDFGFKRDQAKAYHNVEVPEMRNLIIKAAAKDYTNCDCFVCVILSYVTSEGEIYGAEGDKTISLNDLIEPLKGKASQASKSLIGKPKIFLIQACPCDENALVQHDAIGEDGSEPGLVEVAQIPSEADIFIACSSVPGSLTNRGSWFIQTFNDVVKANSKTDDLLTMLTKTQNKIVEKYGDKAEVPFIKSMLTKKLFFKNA